MKKNLPLYILLIFLLLVNSFFLFKYLGGVKDEGDKPNRLQKTGDFIVNTLKLNEEQKAQFHKLNKRHHRNSRRISEEIKSFKDALFGALSDTSMNEADIDSITTLIGQKEKEKDLEIYRHFKSIQELCDEEQKEIFKKIIADAIHKAGRGGPHGPPPPHNRGDGHRPPPHPPEH